MKNPYTKRNLITGLLIYGTGDAIAALISGEFVITRFLGMAIIGALLYGLEIPHYFQWVATRTSGLKKWQAVVLRTLLAMLYFNPLWVSRHLCFIAWLSGGMVTWEILSIGLKSFISAMPITVLANFIIQNTIVLRYRFLASALFSCFMAIFYPVIAGLLAA